MRGENLHAWLREHDRGTGSLVRSLGIAGGTVLGAGDADTPRDNPLPEGRPSNGKDQDDGQHGGPGAPPDSDWATHGRRPWSPRGSMASIWAGWVQRRPARALTGRTPTPRSSGGVPRTTPVSLGGPGPLRHSDPQCHQMSGLYNSRPFGIQAPHPSGRMGRWKTESGSTSHQAQVAVRLRPSPASVTVTRTVPPSRTWPARMALASGSPIAVWTSRRSGRAP